MTSADCPVCNGFGFIPKQLPGVAIVEGWYQRDWRLMLDPSQEWDSCPRCNSGAHKKAPMSGLYDCLARELRLRLERDITSWNLFHGWQYGKMPSGSDTAGQQVFLWRDCACIVPGPMTNFNHYLIVSSMGVLRVEDYDTCAYHLEQAGAPMFPQIEDWP